MELGSQSAQTSARKFTPPFFIGLILVAFFWFASWTRLGWLGQHSFFPLWFGFILTMDGLVSLRGRISLITRAPREFVALFFLSAPIWWLFEGLNHFTLNWHYLVTETISLAQVLIESTIVFSTVIPAVFEATEFVATFAWVQTWRGKPVATERGQATGRPHGLPIHWMLMYLGAGLLLGIIFFPRYFFPALWLWGFFLIDPLNALRGRASLVSQVLHGDWRMVGALAVGVLICGFFWEMWNFYAMPKWYYTVPFFQFGKVFEMPVFGYFGYIPFAWELYALYQFVWGILGSQPTRAVTSPLQ